MHQNLFSLDFDYIYIYLNPNPKKMEMHSFKQHINNKLRRTSAPGSRQGLKDFFMFLLFTHFLCVSLCRESSGLLLIC